MAQTPPMPAETITRLHSLLAQMQDILKPYVDPSPVPDTERNPLWFRPTGHLSDAGIAYLYDLFSRGYSDEKAALALGIAVRSTTARRAAWKRQSLLSTTNKD